MKVSLMVPAMAAQLVDSMVPCSALMKAMLMTKALM
jgi:hypothetical protein